MRFQTVYFDPFIVCDRYTRVVLIERDVQDAFSRWCPMKWHCPSLAQQALLSLAVIGGHMLCKLREATI